MVLGASLVENHPISRVAQKHVTPTRWLVSSLSYLDDLDLRHGVTVAHCIYDITSCSACDKLPLCPNDAEACLKVGDTLSEGFTACDCCEVSGI